VSRKVAVVPGVVKRPTRSYRMKARILLTLLGLLAATSLRAEPSSGRTRAAAGGAGSQLEPQPRAVHQ